VSEQSQLISKQEKSFDQAADVRKFEIGLFWQRSIFFWGFIAAAFIGYADLAKGEETNSDLMITIACFGLVCSVAWTLLNRGSKYWQEAWEQKVERTEKKVLSERLYFNEEPVEIEKGWWLRARRYSVSKLVIALSDFTALVWLFLILKTLPWGMLGRSCFPWPFFTPVLSIAFILTMAICCRSTEQKVDRTTEVQDSRPSSA